MFIEPTPQEVHDLRNKIFDYIEAHCKEDPKSYIIIALAQNIAAMVCTAKTSDELMADVQHVINNFLMNVQEIAHERGLKCTFEFGECDENGQMIKPDKRNLC